MPPPPRPITPLLLLTLALLTLPARADTDQEEIDPIDHALRAGVHYLYQTQSAGHWEPAAPDPLATTRRGELTATAVNALLATGANSQRPQIMTALSFLQATPAASTAAAAAKLRSFEFRDDKTIHATEKDAIKVDATTLANSLHTGAPDAGLHGPSLDPKAAGANILDTAQAAFAIYALSLQNFEIPKEYWKLLDQGVRNAQLKSGAWESPNASPLTATAAALATLLLTQEALAPAKLVPLSGNPKDPAIDSGLAWLNAHAAHVLIDPDPIPTLLNLQRLAHVSGRWNFGPVQVKKAAIDYLVRTQKPDGSWPGRGHPVAATAAALQLLAGQHFPLLMSKLEYQLDVRGQRVTGNWNQRPRDIANFAYWAGPTLCLWRDQWQVVTLDMPLDDLYASHTLYIAGDQTLTFHNADREKLRQFLRNGGLILGNADGGDPAFASSFEKLGEELFSYRFRTLPSDHQIYNEYFRLIRNPEDVPAELALRGLSNGARELMLLIPSADFAAAWQTGKLVGKQRAPAELAVNIAVYAFGKQIRATPAPRPHLIPRDPTLHATRTLHLARLQYRGNWDPEPAGWERLANHLHNTRATDLAVTPVTLGDAKLDPRTYPVAHLTGTAKFQLTQPQRAELKTFVEQGGTLIVDAAGGNPDFTAAAQTELAEIFPTSAKDLADPLPPTNPIYDKLGRVEYRRFAKQTLGYGTRTVRLRAIAVNNRTAVYFSPEDLSVGLVGQEVDGIYGYAPTTATDLMTRIIAGPAK